jgi:hypothetical protein
MGVSQIVFGTLAAIGLALVAGCASETGSMSRSSTARGAASPQLVHAVFFTMKPDAPAGAAASLVADGYQLLARIPTVRRIESGLRDPRFDREYNDQEFTVGLVVYFDDKEGHDVYQDHPLHIEYVEKHKANWAGVRVYDFMTK